MSILALRAEYILTLGRMLICSSYFLDGLCSPCRTKVNFKSKVALQSNGSDDFQNITKNFIMLVIHNDKNRLGKILRTQY